MVITVSSKIYILEENSSFLIVLLTYQILLKHQLQLLSINLYLIPF